MMKPAQLLLLIATFGCLPASNPGNDAGTDQAPEATPVKERSWMDDLYEVEVIGELPTTHKATYVVLRARLCTECDANLTLFVHSPSDGPLGAEDEQVRYAGPGVLLDPIEEDTLLRTRTFLGEVLPGEQGLWWHFIERGEDGGWTESAYLLRVVADTLQGSEVGPDLARMEQLLGAGKVRELPGMTQMAEF